MTPSQVMALIGLWRRQKREGGTIFSSEDVAIEVSLTSGKTYGKIRAMHALRNLAEKKMTRESQFDGYRLTKAAEKFCEALEVMGLPGPE